MKYYDVIEYKKDNNNLCIIFSTTYISPLKSLNEIKEKYINCFKECSDIYFDFLLCNRNQNERFAKVINYQEKLDISNFEYIKVEKKDYIRELSTKYYKENYDYLDWTYVSSIKRKLISKGIVI